MSSGQMADPSELAELNQRIAVVRDYLRDLVEQAAAYSGAGRGTNGRPHRSPGGKAGRFIEAAGSIVQVGRTQGGDSLKPRR